MLANSCSYIALLASSLCVVATHDALLAGKLDNRLADKVCLGKVSGASSKLCLFLVGSLVERNLCSKSLHTLGLLQNRAKLLLKDNGLKALGKLIKRMLQVLLKEELSVIEAGADNALVAVNDALGARWIRIRNHNKLASQLTFSVIDWEIALIGKHGLSNNL